MASISTPPDLLEAVTKLWRLPPPGPESLFSSHPFRHLLQTCERLYPSAGSGETLGFALHNALRVFGLPCGLPPDKQHLALLADDAAYRLDEAFRNTKTLRIHLCPFDCADMIPPLNFGPASVRKFSASELEALVNRPQLQRRYPSWEMDSQGLAAFTWLVVREEARLLGEPGQRAVPVLYEGLDRDLGAIEPHQARFPETVEAALFTLLLAPWEDWVLYTDFDWRAFRTPWVYTTDGDVFCHRATPPSPDTLSWEPCIYTDQFGDEVESERPIQLPRSDSAADASIWVNEARWADVNSAEKALVFGKPVMHFLIRAFLSSGIDEFLAHITVIEAALGTQIDHDTRRRSKIKGSRQGATYRVAMRLSALLGDKSHAADFLRLFNSRSEFLHGRTMQTIAGSDRVLARQLARRAAVELVSTAASQPALPREVFLQQLLDAGQVL